MNTPSHTRVEDELLSIVDENDQVIGVEKRGVIHAQKLRHRSVHILVFNATGQLFLQRRSLNKDTFPDRWDSSSSGHVDAGEDYLQAAVRELSEELSIHNTSPLELQPLVKLSACEQTGQEFTMVYRLEYNGAITVNPAEISRGQFFEPSEIAHLLTSQPQEFAPAFAHLWQMLASASGIEPHGRPS